MIYQSDFEYEDLGEEIRKEITFSLGNNTFLWFSLRTYSKPYQLSRQDIISILISENGDRIKECWSIHCLTKQKTLTSHNTRKDGDILIKQHKWKSIYNTISDCRRTQRSQKSYDTGERSNWNKLSAITTINIHIQHATYTLHYTT